MVEKAKAPMVLQTIIVPKTVASDKQKAIALANSRGKAGKIDETETSWRFRQRDPGDFVAGSFRTINLGGGVKGVAGHLKSGVAKADDEEDIVKSQWTTAYINDLPDECFLFIEGDGTKDDSGKTTPRGKRHFPYKDKDGAIDLLHLRNAIGRIPQSTAPGLDDAKKKELQAKARSLLGETQKSLSVDMLTLKSFSDSVMVTVTPPGAVAFRLAVAKGEHKDALHVPLVYLGEAGDFEPEQIEALRDAVDTIAKNTQPCPVSVSGYGRVDSPSLGGEFDTVYAMLNAPALASIQAAVAKAATDAGLPPIGGEFAPHMALAHVSKTDEVTMTCPPTIKFNFEALHVVVGDEWSDHSFVAQEKKRLSFEIAVRKVDEEEHTVTGVVYAPDEVDAQGDFMTTANVRKMAHNFLAKYNKGASAGLMHEDFTRKLTVVESYLAPQELNIGGDPITAGSWVSCMKILDAEIWKAVKSEQLGSFSLGGVATNARDIKQGD